MASTIKNVIILGASGRVGKIILPILLDSQLNISVLQRPESNFTFDSRANVIKSPYELSKLREAFSGQDAVLSLLGHTSISAQKEAIDAAVDAGIKWFIPSEFGSDTTNPELLKLVPLFNDKVETVDALRSKESTGMSWTSMITGGFFDFCLKEGFFEIDVVKREANIYDSGNVKFDTTITVDIGHALVNLLSNPTVLEKYKNRHVSISSIKTSQNEIVASLEKHLGEKFQRHHVDAEKKGQTSLKRFKNGEFSMDIARDIMMTPVLGGGLGDHDKSLGINNDDVLPGRLVGLDELTKRVLTEMGQL